MDFNRSEIYGRGSGRPCSRLDILFSYYRKSQNPLVDFRNDTWNSHNTWFIRNDISDEFPGIFYEKVTAGNCRGTCSSLCTYFPERPAAF